MLSDELFPSEPVSDELSLDELASDELTSDALMSDELMRMMTRATQGRLELALANSPCCGTACGR